MVWISGLYLLASMLLALYGFNSLYLTWLYWQPHEKDTCPPPPENWPRVTIQLPIYNERYLIQRLLSAIQEIDYPRDRLEIQVLDDSTDETSAIIASLVSQYQDEGLQIIHIHRDMRFGYKAGALAAGLKIATGRFIAIFDADFIPPPDYLMRTIPWFHSPRVGCVQGRWTHVNRNYSILTRLQALGIDGHFLVEQNVRSRNQLFLNFNGTAGIWRRNCIINSGGWQADTLTEDLDLSYRAQIKGWRIIYLPDLCIPAELPVQIEAYKRQQARWARGSLQTIRKLWRPLLTADVSWRIKSLALLHLSGYIVHPLILAALLLSLPLYFTHAPVLGWSLFWLPAALGPPLLFLSAAAPQGPGFLHRLVLLPGLILLGIGLSFNNGRAALAGLLLPRTGDFSRTPKFALQRRSQPWEQSQYTLALNPWGLVEILLALIFLALLCFAWVNLNWELIPWLVVFTGSYGSVAICSLEQALRIQIFTS